MSSSIIRMLWGAIPDAYRTVADKVLSAENKSLPEQLSILTQAERTPGLPVYLFGLIASAKRALAGKDVELFEERALKAMGLL